MREVLIFYVKILFVFYFRIYFISQELKIFIQILMTLGFIKNNPILYNTMKSEVLIQSSKGMKKGLHLLNERKR